MSPGIKCKMVNMEISRQLEGGLCPICKGVLGLKEGINTSAEYM